MSHSIDFKSDSKKHHVVLSEVKWKKQNVFVSFADVKTEADGIMIIEKKGEWTVALCHLLCIYMPLSSHPLEELIKECAAILKVLAKFDFIPSTTCLITVVFCHWEICKYCLLLILASLNMSGLALLSIWSPRIQS